MTTNAGCKASNAEELEMAQQLKGEGNECHTMEKFRQTIDYKATTAKKLEMAKQFKSEGNTFYKMKEFRQAIGKYHRALLQLNGIAHDLGSAGAVNFFPEELMAQWGRKAQVSEEIKPVVRLVEQLKGDCYNNLAACLLQQTNVNYARVVEYCNHVIKIAPENEKAYYRRGLAYYHLKQYDSALESFRQVKNPENDQLIQKDLNKFVNLCKEGLRKDEKALQEVYKGIFKSSGASRNKNDGN